MVSTASTSYRYRFGSGELDFSSRTHIMGILNVTPDSFSDGGQYIDPGLAFERAQQMVEEGADIIDVGGESTRPAGKTYGAGASPVDMEEEIRRIMPVIERLASRIQVPISVDTHKSGVAERALGAGAAIVNDISAFSADAAMPGVVARAGASVILMHMKGTPQTMQDHPVYGDLFGEVTGVLHSAIMKGEQEGIRQMIVDPGIGFGKSHHHNLSLLNGLYRLQSLGRPILVGPSRKSFIGTILDLPVEERLEGTLGAAVCAVLRGAHIVRVHDVGEARRAVLVADAIMRAQT